MLGKRHCGYNTPGQRNSVKGLVIAALLISSRKVGAGIAWAKTLAGKATRFPSS